MNEQVQQMMALAAQGGAPQQGVAVGACGPMAYNPNGAGYAGLAGMGQAGFPGGVMGCQPAPPATNLVQDCATYQECFVPLGFAFGVDQAGNVYPESAIGASPDPSLGPAPFFQLFPRNGWFYIFGLKIFTDPGIAEFDSVITGDSDFNHVLSSTDVATWNTDECFCPVNWGCVSVTNSLKIQAHATAEAGDVIQGVRGSCWGIRRASLYACGPQYQCGVMG